MALALFFSPALAQAEGFLSPESFSAELAPTTGGSAVLASAGTVATGLALMVSGALGLEGDLQIPFGWAAGSLLLGFFLVNWGPGMGDLLNEQPGRFAVRGLLRLRLLVGSPLLLFFPPAMVVGWLAWLGLLGYDIVDAARAPERWAAERSRNHPAYQP